MMAPKSMLTQRISEHSDLARAVVLFVAVIAVMAVLTAVFGFNHAGPSIQLIPDPAGTLPF
jgi:hypothetical protein